jgi:hypothetical protein
MPIRRVISPTYQTAKFEGIRNEASVETEDSAWVKKSVPGARVQVKGGAKCIVRPKRSFDRCSLVPYVIISGMHETQEAAWKDARKMLDI